MSNDKYEYLNLTKDERDVEFGSFKSLREWPTQLRVRNHGGFEQTIDLPKPDGIAITTIKRTSPELPEVLSNLRDELNRYYQRAYFIPERPNRPFVREGLWLDNVAKLVKKYDDNLKATEDPEFDQYPNGRMVFFANKSDKVLFYEQTKPGVGRGYRLTCEPRPKPERAEPMPVRYTWMPTNVRMVRGFVELSPVYQTRRVRDRPNLPTVAPTFPCKCKGTGRDHHIPKHHSNSHDQSGYDELRGYQRNYLELQPSKRKSPVVGYKDPKPKGQPKCPNVTGTDEELAEYVARKAARKAQSLIPEFVDRVAIIMHAAGINNGPWPRTVEEFLRPPIVVWTKPSIYETAVRMARGEDVDGGAPEEDDEWTPSTRLFRYEAEKVPRKRGEAVLRSGGGYGSIHEGEY